MLGFLCLLLLIIIEILLSIYPSISTWLNIALHGVLDIAMKCYYSLITSYDQLMQSQSDKRGTDSPKSLQTEYPNTPFLFQRGRAGSKAHFTLTLYISIENLKKKGSKLVLVELFYACIFHGDSKLTPSYFPRLNNKISSSQ